MGERVTGDASAGVGVDEGLIKIGFFISGEGGDDLAAGGDLATAKHEAKESVQRNKVGAESITSIFSIHDPREIEGVDADVGVEGETDVTATNGITEFLIFVFGVDDDNFGADHHGTEGFEFNSEGFTGTGFSEDDEVGVF